MDPEPLCRPFFICALSAVGGIASADDADLPINEIQLIGSFEQIQ
jgi:hypothetical protein